MSMRLVLIATVAMALHGGHAAADEEDRVDALQGAVDVVKQLIEAHFPEDRDIFETWSMTITDRESYWEIRFVPRRIVQGGGPVFKLKKGTLEVLEAYAEQ